MSKEHKVTINMRDVNPRDIALWCDENEINARTIPYKGPQLDLVFESEQDAVACKLRFNCE